MHNIKNAETLKKKKELDFVAFIALMLNILMQMRLNGNIRNSASLDSFHL